jgi:hypothetical protein
MLHLHILILLIKNDEYKVNFSFFYKKCILILAQIDWTV